MGFLRCLVPTIPGDAKASMRGTGNKLAPRFFVSIRFVQVAHEQAKYMSLKFIECTGLLESGQGEDRMLINPSAIVRMTFCENHKVNLYMSNGDVIVINISELDKFVADAKEII